MIDHPLTYWLILSRDKLAHRTSIAELLDHYRDPEHFVKDNIRSFSGLKDIGWPSIEKACRWADDPNQHILTFCDPIYPALLKEISHPPPILYIRGRPETLRLPQLAIVGSRYPSHSGLTITQTFASSLANAGLCITSGLALGIDGASHHAAIASGGQTVAVLGNGLDSVYPKQHGALANTITEHGCVISEFPLDAPPNRKHFPQRNRIISGLSLGTLLVEAKLRSGSLITARCAAEQGREVFAIPGSIRHSLSHGCHQLLRDGAVLVESPKDIVDALNISPISTISATFISECNSRLSGLDSKQQQLLACVDYEGTSTDEVIERSGLSTPLVARLLLNLELHGYINSTPRGYMRVKK